MRAEKAKKAPSLWKVSGEARTVRYHDPLKDEFSGVGPRRSILIDETYPYINGHVWYRALTFFVYRLAVTPVAFLYSFFKFRLKIVGKEKLKPFRRRGIFLYGNHTQMPGDGFMPNVLTFPKDTYMIVNPDNVAAPGTRNLMMMLGTLPTPTTLKGFEPFTAAIRQRYEEGGCITVFPEAHIWPYCTQIRPFGAVSFRYPVQLDAPVFTFTVTYRRSARGRPRAVAFVDGPFTGRGETVKKRQQDLRDQVYEAMCARAHTPENQAFVRYEPADPNGEPTEKEKEMQG